jgi:DNA repair exonuclease SbcCD ATPase subunit
VNIIGSVDDPLPFGLVDLQQGVELAARCAFGVACAPIFRDRPGLAWQLVRRKTLGDLKRWTEQQTGAMEWLREQKREYERALGEAREWIGRQEQGRAWLEQNAASLSSRLETLAKEAGDERERLRGAIEELKRGAEWQAGQRRELEERVRERDRLLAELRGFVEAQKKSIDERLGQKDARIAELQAAVARLTEARDWALRQRDVFRAKAEKGAERPADRRAE